MSHHVVISWPAALITYALLILHSQATPDDSGISVIKLPALHIDGQPARAHTQGLEILANNYYVTARRDDVRPKRALLLRTQANRPDWDIWDLTPTDAQGNLTTLDHPGGLQSDGERLWIPLAESKRHGRGLIRCFSIARLVPGQLAKAEFEFPVNDHVGALAVSAERKIIFGANWDTQTVYLWDFAGHLQRTLTDTELANRGLGVANGPNEPAPRSGLAVQDWKIVGDRLFASGLLPRLTPDSRRSQLISFGRFAETAFQRTALSPPKQGEIELAQEAMAVSDGQIHFLPEDLAATNRIFRVVLADLLKPSVPSQ